MKGLKDNAQVFAAPVGQCVGIHVAQPLTAHQNLSTGRSLEARQQQKQRRFPASGGAGYCQCVAGRDLE